MRRTTAWTLALGVGLPLSFAGVGSVLLRMQSARLRRAVDLDSRRRIPDLDLLVDSRLGRFEPLPPADRDAEDFPALAVLGDSWLAGLGVGHRRRTPPLLLARGLSTMLDRPVRLRSVARPSARADDIVDQVHAVLSDRRLRRSRSGAGEARYAVISMGTADLIHPITGSIGIPVLSNAINRLQREGGYRVIVLTCPNLGLPGTPRPLRDVLRRSSRVLSGSQWLAAVSTGAVPVSTNRALAGTSRIGLISIEGRYPSPLGYAQLSAAVLRRIASDLDLPRAVLPGGEEPPANEGAELAHPSGPSGPRTSTLREAPDDRRPAPDPEEIPS
ncbi:hypothetical protein GCM10022261_26880 [Brevibacterium daeguense]|uniref:SGNH/GDSL hydrolase family protein n=1 Tax=Brevibacterium daeguense TaxID=909936 RepID=A0ABP8EN05_9MICO|nr:SGNH/GDSL hydrolase family protein [Brevibacterium daeguense]